MFWRLSHSRFPDRAPRGKVHETTKTWKLLSWNERDVHEILNNCCWGFVGRKWCLRCAPKLNLVMFEKKQCLRDAQIWASPFWNRPNVYEIIGTCMLVSFGTNIMLAGFLKTWNSGFLNKNYVYHILKSWIFRFRSNRYVFELLQTCTSVIKKQK